MRYHEIGCIPPGGPRNRRESPAGANGITVSSRPAIPRRVAPQQSPLPLRRQSHYSSAIHTGNAFVPVNLSPFSCLTHGVQSTLGSTYLELWARVHDEGMVSVSSYREHALHAGFSGQRAERTWRERLRAIEQLGFIMIAPRPPLPPQKVLILNPYQVLAEMQRTGKLKKFEEQWLALLSRASEIGASSEFPRVPEIKKKVSPK